MLLRSPCGTRAPGAPPPMAPGVPPRFLDRRSWKISSLLQVQLFDVPQRRVVQDRRLEISDAFLGPDQKVRTRNADYRKLVGDDRLHVVVKLLALLRTNGRK